jgi:hypothetical protein
VKVAGTLRRKEQQGSDSKPRLVDFVQRIFLLLKSLVVRQQTAQGDVASQLPMTSVEFFKRVRDPFDPNIESTLRAKVPLRKSHHLPCGDERSAGKENPVNIYSSLGAGR